MAADGFVAAANRSSSLAAAKQMDPIRQQASGSKANGSGLAAGQRQQSRWIQSDSRPAAAKQMDPVRQSRSEGGIPRSEKMEKGGSGWEKNQVMTGDVATVAPPFKEKGKLGFFGFGLGF
ncbi:hypothetical protein SLEP1_g53315 [Rubroshorea leprosula]|uniref:Uncharacterized protein n=1 Tax=Rubroshorea leprosula TaxID=152421 RepID=A0AAV5M916_9ROSI|nr:hypothetical protein SLEP1_g53315 [Rubroshorea leprosula]